MFPSQIGARWDVERFPIIKGYKGNNMWIDKYNYISSLLFYCYLYVILKDGRWTAFGLIYLFYVHIAGYIAECYLGMCVHHYKDRYPRWVADLADHDNCASCLSDYHCCGCGYVSRVTLPGWPQVSDHSKGCIQYWTQGLAYFTHLQNPCKNMAWSIINQHEIKFGFISSK